MKMRPGKRVGNQYRISIQWSDEDNELVNEKIVLKADFGDNARL